MSGFVQKDPTSLHTLQKVLLLLSGLHCKALLCCHQQLFFAAANLSRMFFATDAAQVCKQKLGARSGSCLPGEKPGTREGCNASLAHSTTLETSDLYPFGQAELASGGSSGEVGQVLVKWDRFLLEKWDRVLVEKWDRVLVCYMSLATF